MTGPSTPDRAPLSSWFPGYLALTLIWGSSFLFIKLGVAQLHPTHVALGRVATGAAAVLIILAVTRTKLPRDLRTWGHFAFVGVIGAALPFTLFGYAEQRIPSLLAGIWNATTPLFVMPIAALVFRTEEFTARRVAGLITGFVGVLVVLGVWRGVGGAEFIGQMMCLGAALCYGVVIPYARRFLGHLEGAAAPAGQLITAVAAMAVASAVLGGRPPVDTLSWVTIASVVALGALGTGVAFVLNFRVIKFAGASTAASVTYLAPVVATVIGVVGLGEQITWQQPVGAIIVIVGVAVAQGAFSRRARTELEAPDKPVTAVDAPK